MGVLVIVTERDTDILGVANSIDGMGVLAVWSQRGRDLIPHLTAQTTNARGFMVMLEALRLAEELSQDEPELADRTADVFLVFEQMIARIVGEKTGNWPLPGRRRVLGRRGQPAAVSVEDRGLHLLASQRGNGLWGLYRGAAGRAGLLDGDLERISGAVFGDVQDAAMIRSAGAKDRVRSTVLEALGGGTPAVATDADDPVVTEVMEAWGSLPVRSLLHTAFVETTDLTRTLTSVLLEEPDDRIDRRRVIDRAAGLLPSDAAVLHDVVRCEDYLAVLESTFFHACAAGGTRTPITEVEAWSQLDLPAISAARDAFESSGHYDGVARRRADAYAQRVDTSSVSSYVESVLGVHEWVASGRRRAVWSWVDDGWLQADVVVDAPDEGMLTAGMAWRNDYFLSALRSVAKDLVDRPLT